MADALPSHEDVLTFWFGRLDEHGLATPEASARWWKKDPAFDEEIRARFGGLHLAIMRDERESWLRSARSLLAYVIVLDQFSRNMFRGTPEMFASDARAVAAAEAGIEAGLDRQLACAERVFLYMPFMHVESVPAQHRCVALFERLAAEVEGPAQKDVRSNVGFAERHRDIVVRFGRFPHRNTTLGRDSTDEEVAFLREPHSSF